MSKLYDTYLWLKANEKDASKTLYLFKSGIFFILLDEDAKIASNFFNLKLTHFTENVLKCGFPSNSLEKYSNLIKQTDYSFKIIDNNTKVSYSITNYSNDEKKEKLLLEILNVDTNNLSVKEAYDFIDTIKLKAKSIIGGNNTNDK